MMMMMRTTRTTRTTTTTRANARATKRRTTRVATRARANGERGTSASAASTSRDDGRNRIGEIVATTASALALAMGAPDARAIDMQIVDSTTSEYMRRRDEAASFKCSGGMFDCDSDRREYARAQTERLRARIATRDPEMDAEEALKDPEMDAEEALKSSPCTVEDPCTDNVLQAAFAGVQGLTTSEKLEKMGRPTDAVNSSSQYFGF